MSFVSATLRLSAGAIVWALHFAFVYGFTALACALGFTHAVPWVIFMATLAAGAACVLLIAREWPPQTFESWLASGIAATALLAIVWETLPVFIVPVCR